MNDTRAHESDIRKNLLFQKVGIFVDAENIEMSSLKHHEGRTDYKKIIEKVGDREILRILYYKPIYKEISQTFREFWKRLGGEIKQPAKNADSFLIIDAVTLAEKLDVAILVGGDKDYLPLVWYLKSRGCRVEVWSWPESTSPEFREAADVYFPLTKEFIMEFSEEKEAVPAPKPPPQARPQSPPAQEAPSRGTPAPRAQSRTHGQRSAQPKPPPGAPREGAGRNSNPRAPASAAPKARPAPEPETKIEAVETTSAEAPASGTKKKTRRGSRGGRGRRGSRGGGGGAPPASESGSGSPTDSES